MSGLRTAQSLWPSAMFPKASFRLHPLRACVRCCACREGETVSAEALAEGLQHLGYRLEPSEVALLTNRMRRGEQEDVPKSAFMASQIDWAALLQDHRYCSLGLLL